MLAPGGCLVRLWGRRGSLESFATAAASRVRDDEGRRYTSESLLDDGARENYTSSPSQPSAGSLPPASWNLVSGAETRTSKLQLLPLATDRVCALLSLLIRKFLRP